MNKKTVFIFLIGVFSSALVFAVVSLTTQKNLPHEAIRARALSENVLKPEEIKETQAFQSLLSREPDAHSTFYEVRPGDSLTSIAKAHQATIEIIKRINQLSSDKLFPGMKLKIPNYKFSIVVDKSQNILIFKGDEEVLKTYVVATGENNSTPVGVFKITDKLVNPTWYKAGTVVPYGSPENVLGTRWMGWTKKGYGIHGTSEPESLGRQVTAGCVRMRNEEVEELFSFVPPGTEVTIVD